jgi:hypothetical protein
MPIRSATRLPGEKSPGDPAQSQPQAPPRKAANTVIALRRRNAELVFFAPSRFRLPYFTPRTLTAKRRASLSNL